MAKDGFEDDAEGDGEAGDVEGEMLGEFGEALEMVGGVARGESAEGLGTKVGHSETLDEKRWA